MEPSQRIWLTGLRRAWIESGALADWIAERGVSGVVWTPGAYEIDDAAEGLVSLVEAGAKADGALLHDLVVEDVRGAADLLADTYRSSDGRTGYVAAWLDAARSGDPGRATAAARELFSDVRRANVAAALAWTPQRGPVVEALVAAGIPVALSGVGDGPARDDVAKARVAGMDRCRRDAEKRNVPPEAIPEIPVFLLGAGGADPESGDAVFPVALSSELGLYSKAAAPPDVPVTPEAEQAQGRAALDALVARASEPARDDDVTPPYFAAAVAAECRELRTDDVLADIWNRDHTTWSDDDDTEISDRLGWLDSPEAMHRELDDINAFSRKVRAGGEVQHIVLCGMGGSSLAPHTFRTVLGGGLPLTVLDTTDPDHIEALTASLTIDRTLFVVASKSGTTIETRAQLEHFWALSGRGDRFVAITDPGTELAKLAAERGFSRTFENAPDVGGRFSAITYFGLVPAALAGADVDAIVHGARRALRRNGPSVAATSAPAARLAAAIGEAKLTDGRDKLTLVLPKAIESFGPWVEQLIAESTGKRGTGILPVVGEELGPPVAYGDDRIFCVYTVGDEAPPSGLEAIAEDHPVVRIRIPSPRAIGAEVYRWEMATAILGYLLDINPFDQPDVESAKRRARETLDGAAGARPEPGSAAELFVDVAPPAYVAIQAFLPPTDDNVRRLEAVRTKLRDRHRVAVTVGFGPRFLHSTGQLHKGGPAAGVYVQVTGPHASDLDVPGMGFSFGKLFDAQADGDLHALRDAGRRAARVTVEQLETVAQG